MRVTVSAMVLAGLLALAGCIPGAPGSDLFGDGSQADRVVKGMPDGWEGPDPDLFNGDPVVGWVSDTEFGVITVGSGSCPAVAGELQVLGSDEVQVEFGPSPHDPCTADMAATTHVFELPSSVSERPVTVTVQFAEYETEYLLDLATQTAAFPEPPTRLPSTRGRSVIRR
ncbi:hypothetical protein GCM10009749_26380 [Agromyces neolithicus]|uniref:Uncharacterized protein n=2 Tax=Agromyces neolithicus TaxID=269420 RepID=A0ABP4YIW8_9MICO